MTFCLIKYQEVDLLEAKLTLCNFMTHRRSSHEETKIIGLVWTLWKY